MQVQEALKLSKIAYADADKFKLEHPEAVFFDCEGEDVQFYSCVVQNKLIIVFRGSSSMEDFVADAKFFQKKVSQEISTTPEIKCHSGFLNQFMAALPTLVKILSTNHLDVVVVGHSLGGALATICAMHLKCGSLKSNKHVTCITFGSPRVGNAAFVKEFDAHIDSIRVVNCCDIVTMKPYFGYYHVKGEMKIGTSKSTFSKWFGSVKDHYLSSYQESLV